MATAQTRRPTISQQATMSAFSENKTKSFSRGLGKVLLFSLGAVTIVAGLTVTYLSTAALWSMALGLFSMGGVVPVLAAVFVIGSLIPVTIIVPTVIGTSAGAIMIDHSINS